VSASPYRTAGGVPRPPDPPRPDAARTAPRVTERDLGEVMDDLGAWEHVPGVESVKRSYELHLRQQLDAPPVLWWRAIGAEREGAAGW
jgi:hypothetical protein